MKGDVFEIHDVVVNSHFSALSNQRQFH